MDIRALGVEGVVGRCLGLGAPEVDVVAGLRLLSEATASAFGSYLGFTVAIPGGMPPVQLTWLHETPGPQGATTPGRDVRAGSSLRIRLPGFTPSAPSVELVLYAAAPGALVDVAADLAFLTGGELADFVLDQDRDLPVSPAGWEVLDDWVALNQALGVLMADRLTPQEAGHELDQRARTAGTSLRVVVDQVIGGVTGCSWGGPPTPGLTVGK